MLLLKGRDCIGGSPSGLGSIDFFLEFRIGDGTLRLDTTIDPERAIALGFAAHEDGLDHPLVTITPPHVELPRQGGGAARQRWPGVITGVLEAADGRPRPVAVQRPAQRRLIDISDADDFPLLFLRIWEYLALLDGFARAVKRVVGAALEAVMARRRRGLVDARIAALETLGLGLDEEAVRARAAGQAESDMTRAVEVTRRRAELEREAAGAGADPAIIAAEEAREEELVRAAEAADDDEEEGAGPQPGPGQGSPARRRRRRGGGG